MHLVVRLALVFVLAGGAVTACGDDSDEGTQPRPDVTTFEQARLDDIPLHPTSRPIGEPAEEDGTVSRSYVVRNTTPEEVLRFYGNRLSAFEVIEEPGKLGADTYRGRWLVEGRELTVSASRAGTVEGEEVGFGNADVITQYSLSLTAD